MLQVDLFGVFPSGIATTARICSFTFHFDSSLTPVHNAFAKAIELPV